MLNNQTDHCILPRSSTNESIPREGRGKELPRFNVRQPPFCSRCSKTRLRNTYPDVVGAAFRQRRGLLKSALVARAKERARGGPRVPRRVDRCKREAERSRGVPSVSVDWSLISSHNESRSRRYIQATATGALVLISCTLKGTGATRRTGDIKDSETRLINFLI